MTDDQFRLFLNDFIISLKKRCREFKINIGLHSVIGLSCILLGAHARYFLNGTPLSCFIYYTLGLTNICFAFLNGLCLENYKKVIVDLEEKIKILTRE